jgi:hypothetical protein
MDLVKVHSAVEQGFLKPVPPAEAIPAARRLRGMP